MRQLTIAYKCPEAAGIEEALCGARDAIDHYPSSEVVARSVPALPAHREAQRVRRVYVGEFECFVLTLVGGDSNEQSDIGSQLLLEVEGHTELGVKASHGCDIRRLAGQLRDRGRLIVLPHVCAHRESEDPQDPRLRRKLVSSFPLGNDLELREDMRVELRAVRHDRKIEKPEAKCVLALVPLGGNPVGVAPGRWLRNRT